MNSSMLRSALIQSAALLAVISLLVYLTATSPEGSIWASIGALFMALVRIAQLSLGLALALVFCLAVLTGIFLGCVAAISRESAAGMVEQLRQDISDKYFFVRGLIVRDSPAIKTHDVQEYGKDLKVEIQRIVDNSLASLKKDQSEALDKIPVLDQRIGDAATRVDVESLSQQLTQQEKEIQEFTGVVDAVQEKIAGLQTAIDDLKGQAASGDSKKDFEDLNNRMDDLQQSNASLQEELAQMQKIVQARDKSAKQDTSADEGFVEHRLFAHLTNKAMQEKVAKLVTDSLETNMSYAQVIDHLVKQTKGKTAEIIASHPSLVKEYIKYRRDNG